MPQKLSAMKYIKNNKRRVSVLIISLTLCFVLFYLSQFLLSVTTETFKVMLLDNAEKIQYAVLSSSTFNLYTEDYDELGEEEFLKVRYERTAELVEKLKKEKGIIDVYYTDIYYIPLYALVGQWGAELPLLPPEELSKIMEHFDATLIDGKMPEKEGEILLDEKYLINNGYQIGDSLEDYKDLKVVGVMQSDYYIAFGATEKKGIPAYNPQIVVLSDGSIRDLSKLIHSLGHEFDTKDSRITDYVTGEKDLKKNVTDAISGSTTVLFIGITLLLSLAILILYVSYLRDRKNEWCLYASIGFSRKSIYAAVMHELLFTFGSALLIGGVITAISVVILDHTMVQSLGLKCRYWYPNELFQILCVFLFILGILQIPVRIALYKIRTIDAIDDDLN